MTTPPIAHPLENEGILTPSPLQGEGWDEVKSKWLEMTIVFIWIPPLKHTGWNDRIF